MSGDVVHIDEGVLVRTADDGDPFVVVAWETVTSATTRSEFGIRGTHLGLVLELAPPLPTVEDLAEQYYESRAECARTTAGHVVVTWSGLTDAARSSHVAAMALFVDEHGIEVRASVPAPEPKPATTALQLAQAMYAAHAHETSARWEHLDHTGASRWITTARLVAEALDLELTDE